MKYLWHWFVELLCRWGILDRDVKPVAGYIQPGHRDRGQRYSRRKNLFPSAARQLRELRKKSGLSEREVAELWGKAMRRWDGIRIGAKSQYVSECEQGHRSASVREFALLREVANG